MLTQVGTSGPGRPDCSLSPPGQYCFGNGCFKPEHPFHSAGSGKSTQSPASSFKV